MDEDRIVVVDSYPGSGKTSWAIQHINELPDDVKVIYITPYLEEVQRVIDACPKKKFRQPNTKSGSGSKMSHLKKLIGKGENVVSTHALFKSIDDQLINLLRSNDYILFLDEVFQTVEKYNITSDNRIDDAEEITKRDINILINQGHIRIEDDYRVTWIDISKPLSKYSNLISLCERELLYYVGDSLLLWTFPIEIFMEGIFQYIYILTYKFESQLQYYYYRYFNIEYKKYVASKKDDRFYIEKSERNERESEWKKSIKEKVTIIENHKINKIGDPYNDLKNRIHNTSLSMNWYASNPDACSILKNNLQNYFSNISKSKSEERLWTCFKEDIKHIKSKNISMKSWLACNARATNNYGNKTSLAYLINRYLDPFYDDFFSKKNIKVDQDEYGLSEMIQWIWRSAIRNNKNITIYIPSKRMRDLFKNFLDEDQ